MDLRASADHREGLRFVVTAGSHSLATDHPLDAAEPVVAPDRGRGQGTALRSVLTLPSAGQARMKAPSDTDTPTPEPGD